MHYNFDIATHLLLDAREDKAQICHEAGVLLQDILKNSFPTLEIAVRTYYGNSPANTLFDCGTLLRIEGIAEGVIGHIRDKFDV